jgi:hypothetical protein
VAYISVVSGTATTCNGTAKTISVVALTGAGPLEFNPFYGTTSIPITAIATNLIPSM